MEFSDCSQPHPLDKQCLPQCLVDKENQPHLLTASGNQLYKYNSATKDKQPHPPPSNVEEPHPPPTTGRYYKLIKQYLSKNNNNQSSVSPDAWTLTREYFDNI